MKKKKNNKAKKIEAKKNSFSPKGDKKFIIQSDGKGIWGIDYTNGNSIGVQINNGTNPYKSNINIDNDNLTDTHGISYEDDFTNIDNQISASKNKKPKIFISHCGDDKEIMTWFHATIIPALSDVADVFSTYTDENGTVAGDKLAEVLRSSLNDSVIMISMITDSYLRSEVCLEEISTFWYLDYKKIIPIVFNKSNGKNYLSRLTNETLIYIDKELTSEKCTDKLLASLSKFGIDVYGGKHDSFNRFMVRKNAILKFFQNAEQAVASRPYIGSGNFYNDAIKYLELSGIEKFNNNPVPLVELYNKLLGSDEIIMLGTTVLHTINSLSTEYISELLIKGTKITILLPEKQSEYISDIALIGTPHFHKMHFKKLKKEFAVTIRNLILDVKEADRKTKKDKKWIRHHINLGCSRNLLRQTIIIARKGNELWGITSLNVPPVKPISGTPTIVFKGTIDDNKDFNSFEQSFALKIYKHIKKIRKIAKKHGKKTWFEITSDAKPSDIKFDTTIK